MTDQERIVEVLKRLDPTFERPWEGSKSYHTCLIECLVLLQLDAQEMLKGMLEPKVPHIECLDDLRDSRRRLNPDGSSPWNEANVELEPAVPPDPRVVWPSQDVKRFVLTIDVPLAQLETFGYQWPQIVYSALHHYTENTDESGRPEHFATLFDSRIDVSMHAASAVLRTSVATDSAESNVDLPKCVAKPVQMALHLIRDVIERCDAFEIRLAAKLRIQSAIQLLEAAIHVGNIYRDTPHASIPPGLEIDWEVAKRSVATDPGAGLSDEERLKHIRDLGPWGIEAASWIAHLKTANDGAFNAAMANGSRMQALHTENEVAIRFLREARGLLYEGATAELYRDEARGLVERIDRWLVKPSAVTRCGYKTPGGDRCELVDDHDGPHHVSGITYLRERAQPDPVAIFEDELERAYWNFDHYHKLPDPRGGLAPLSERDAFKRAVREMKGGAFGPLTLDDIDRIRAKMDAAGVQPMKSDGADVIARAIHAADERRIERELSADEQLGDDKAAMKREAAARLVSSRHWELDMRPTRSITLPADMSEINAKLAAGKQVAFETRVRVLEKEATEVAPGLFHVPLSPEDTSKPGTVEVRFKNPHDPNEEFGIVCNVVGEGNPRGTDLLINDQGKPAFHAERLRIVDSEGAVVLDTDQPTIPLVMPNGTTIDVPTAPQGRRFGKVPPVPNEDCGCALLDTPQGPSCQRGGLLCRCKCHENMPLGIDRCAK